MFRLDIVTDILHASSSDLITWHTLAMVRQKLQEHILPTWHEITVACLEAWKERGRDINRKGFRNLVACGLVSLAWTRIL